MSNSAWTRSGRFLALAALGLFGIGSVTLAPGCEEQTTTPPAPTPVPTLEDQTEDAADNLRDAADETGDALENAADNAEDAAEEMAP